MLLLGACLNSEEKLMDNSKPYFVWYSQKQNEVQETHNSAILEDSSIVVYTELTKSKIPSGKWDDYTYLGRGKWYKVIL